MRAQLSPAWHDWALDRFEAVGELAATRWADLAVTANEQPPRLRTHNRWGERIDEVEVHPAYDQMAREAYEAGVVWPRFNAVLDGQKAPWSVVFGLGYMFGQAEQGMFCPICLTAGTAYLAKAGLASAEGLRVALARFAAENLVGETAALRQRVLEGAPSLAEAGRLLVGA